MPPAPYPTWPRRVLADLRAGAKAFGPVSPRHAVHADPLPLRGRGTRPDGGVTLAVQDRFVLTKDLTRDPPRDALGPTILDSVPLSAAEWSGFAPGAARPGVKWQVPDAVVRKLYPLLSVADTVFRDPKEVTAVRLAGRVEKVEGGVARLVYEGEMAGIHHGTAGEGKFGKKCSAEAKILGGVGAFDVKTGKMITLTLVYDGLWRNYAPYDDPPGRFGAVVEWSDGRAAPGR